MSETMQEVFMLDDGTVAKHDNYIKAKEEYMKAFMEWCKKQARKEWDDNLEDIKNEWLGKRIHELNMKDIFEGGE